MKEVAVPSRAKVGKWRLDFRDQDGVRVREAFDGNRTDAKSALNDRRVAVQRAKDGKAEGAYVNPRRSKANAVPTFNQFTNEFLSKYNGRSSRPRSDHYPQNINALSPFFGSIFGSMLLNEITPRQIAQYSAQRSEKVGPSTLRKNLIVLGTVLNAVVEWGVLDAHLAPRIKKPGEPSHRVQYLRREDFDSLLVAAPPWLRPMFRLALHAGLRLKEVTGLRWEDVDLRGRVLYVNPDNKTGRPYPIRITGAAKEVLKELQARRKAIGRELGTVLPHVFTDDAGNDYYDEKTRNRITKLTKQTMNAIGHPEYSFITLRHTTVSWLAQAGIDLARVREHMRHTNIQATLRYAHLRPRHLDDVVEALDRAAAASVRASRSAKQGA